MLRNVSGIPGTEGNIFLADGSRRPTRIWPFKMHASARGRMLSGDYSFARWNRVTPHNIAIEPSTGGWEARRAEQTLDNRE